MAGLIALSLLLGATLSLRFNICVLVPATCLGLVAAVLDGLARSNRVWWTISAMLAVTAAMQLGYLAGSLVPVSDVGFANPQRRLVFILVHFLRGSGNSPGNCGDTGWPPGIFRPVLSKSACASVLPPSVATSRGRGRVKTVESRL